MGAIDSFISNMARSEGFARTAQYELVVNLPSLMSNQEMSQRLSLNCELINWPGHDLQTQSRKHGNEPERLLVTGHGFEGTITASFYLSQNHDERFLMEQWQELAVNRFTHKANYYNEYTGSMELYQLGSAKATRTYTREGAPIVGNPNTDKGPDVVVGKESTNVAVRKYGIAIANVYPQTIAFNELSADLSNEIQRLAVTFNYRQHLPIHLHNGNRKPFM